VKKTISFLLTLFPFLFAGFLLLFLSTSCRLYKLEQKLDPKNADWFSKVRYIITREERKIFLELPDSEKEKYKEEFWKRRDPDPDTEENEFKTEYYNRMERADELFSGEGKPGWLTDRGRIYILFGPPTDRITYPMGEDSYSRCSEIWYYGNFPVIFVDSTCAGNYVMVTLNLEHLHELNLAQDYVSKTFTKEKEFFDFNLEIKKILVEENRVVGMIVIEVPYNEIWLKSEAEKFQTTLELHLELEDSENVLFWEYRNSYEVAMDEAELKEKKGKKYQIEVPFTLEKDLSRLRQGKNMLHALLKNKTGGEDLKKVMEFNL
jgi:GWxTD domain-containing protein